MIHPTFQITEELYIHAARAAVWSRFCRVPDWPRWRADVANATWVRGQSWQEGAQFTVSSVSNSPAQPQTFTIRDARGIALSAALRVLQPSKNCPDIFNLF